MLWNQNQTNLRGLSSEDWVFLNEGDNVLVQRIGEPLRSGQIDVLTEDARAFWVHLDEGRGRILIYEDDGSIVRLNPHQGNQQRTHLPQPARTLNVSRM